MPGREGRAVVAAVAALPERAEDTIRAGAHSCPLRRDRRETIAEADKEAWVGDGRQMRSAEGLRMDKVGNGK